MKPIRQKSKAAKEAQDKREWDEALCEFYNFHVNKSEFEAALAKVRAANIVAQTAKELREMGFPEPDAKPRKRSRWSRLLSAIGIQSDRSGRPPADK